jgi:hypothetical protein
MWLYLSRTLPVSSQPIISPHQELSEDAKQDTMLFAPPRPGTDQSDAHCTLPYTGKRIFVIHCMSTRWKQLLAALLTRRAFRNREEWLWNGMNRQLFAYKRFVYSSVCLMFNNKLFSQYWISELYNRQGIFSRLRKYGGSLTYELNSFTRAGRNSSWS